MCLGYWLHANKAQCIFPSVYHLYVYPCIYRSAHVCEYACVSMRVYTGSYVWCVSCPQPQPQIHYMKPVSLDPPGARWLSEHQRDAKEPPLHFGRTVCRCCLLLIIHQLPFLTPFILELVKKKKKAKQPDVSPVSSVIHKPPSTPHSSLRLYEKLKLNQGGVIKLSDFFAGFG